MRRGGAMRENIHETPGKEAPALLQGVSENVTRLVRDHIELAKIELQESVKKVVRDSALVGAGAAIALLGYVLLTIAVAIGLGHEVGMARGFLLVSAFHVLVGGLLVTVFAKRLKGKDKPGLPATTTELKRDREFIQDVRQIVRRPEGSRA